MNTLKKNNNVNESVIKITENELITIIKENISKYLKINNIII